MLIHTVRDNNPNQKGRQPHIDSITSMVHNGMCALIIDQDEMLSRVLLPMMRISTTLGDVLLAQYMDEEFPALHMSIVRLGMG